MIFTFMLAYSYGIIIYRIIKNQWNSFLFARFNSGTDVPIYEVEFELAYDGTTYYENGQLRFAPNVRIQRYMVVIEQLKRLGTFKKVVDLGCSECGFFNYLKHLKGIEELILVDLDEYILERKSDALKPLTIDFLRPRETPLNIKVLHGNAAVPDSKLADTSAVVAIELIEHMFPPDLDNLPYSLFGVIQPEVVIITTPNYDFNVVFNLNGFRHLDHKFEWTRRQFKDWVNNLLLRFPYYSAKLYGVGPGPENTYQYGTCTQMVVFQRKINSDPDYLSMENSYHVISEIEYPYSPKVEFSVEEEIIYHAEKFIAYAIDLDKYHVNCQIEIPLSSIMKMVTRHTDSQELLQSVLENKGWQIKKNKSGKKCVILSSSGISFSRLSSQSSDIDDEDDTKVFEMFNSWETNPGSSCEHGMSDECWSGPEDTVAQLNPESCANIGISSLVNCKSCNGLECKCDKQKGCYTGGCHVLDECLADKLSITCNNDLSNTFQPLERGVEKSASKAESDGCIEIKLCKEPALMADISAGSVASENVCCSMSVCKKQNSPLNQVSNDSTQNLCSINIQSEIKPDSLDSQQKIENESLDRFDESSLATCHGTKDMFTVKRSLDLPLESVKKNFNGNFESNGPDNKKLSELKGTTTLENIYKEIKKVDCSSGTVEFYSINDSNLTKFGSSSINSTSQVTVSQSSFDVKGIMSSDFRERGDPSLGQNPSGINRCLSLQHIKEKEGASKSNRFSLCCEKENINICDIFKDGLKTKSCGHSFDEVIDLIRVDTIANFDDSCSQSKAADSGYPNTSDRDMDMDLTPEQVDELLSENESSQDEREDDEDREVGGAAPIQFLDHVENGDVANNNRDGEGNNLDQEELGQPLHFQQIIQEEGNDIPLNEAPPQIDSDSENEEKFLSCNSYVTTDSNVTVVESIGSDELRTCQGWTIASTPCHSRAETWSPLDISSLQTSTLTVSSTSLVVHPSSATLSFTVLDEFPSWLLGIEIDDIGDFENNSVPESSSIYSQENIFDEDLSEIVIPGDLLGGGEPHTQL